MGLETGNYINDLVVTNPESTDKRRFGDDHFRLVKRVLKNSFPTVDGPLTPSLLEFSYLEGVTSAVQDQLDAKLVATDITDMAKTSVQNIFTQGQATQEVEITFDTEMTPDAELSNAFWITATDDFILEAPVNGITGQVLTVLIQQDLSGSRLMTFGATYYGSPTDDLTLTTDPNAVDLLTLLLGGNGTRWYVAGLKKDIDNAV